MGNKHLTFEIPENMSKNKVIIEIWICPKIATIHSIILKGHINSGYHLNACSTTPVHASDKLTDCPKIISCQTSTRALVSSWTVVGGLGIRRMRWSMMSQRCSVWFRSGERAGQPIVSIPSSSKIAGTLLPHEVGHCSVPGETQDLLHQCRA